MSVWLLIGLPAVPVAHAQEVTGEQVRAAIDKAKTYLLQSQRRDGRWTEHVMAGGTTALATLALLNAGVPADDDQIKKSIAVIRAIPLEYTYVVSLKIQALAAADPARHRDAIARAAEWLVRAQLNNGMWGYGQTGGRGDFSNSQFALLGLHEAGRAGARIPAIVWTRARLAWVNAQNEDNGWAYTPGASRSTGSMTAAGIASLYICGNSLTMARSPKKNDQGEIVCCQPHAEFRPIARGFQWMAQNFSSTKNPNAGSWYYYYMYGIERVGILSGMRYFGPHDWYREGTAQLLRLQRADGSWRETHPTTDTAFALLFLAKGYKPVLFNKLQWSNDAAWNLTRNDLSHLVAFIGDRLGEPMSWEVVSTSDDVKKWLIAPIVYFNGRQFPAFKPDEVARIREYIQQGGTILICATCDTAGFRQGFEAFAKTAFADDVVMRLPADHPVFHTVFPIDADKTELLGLNIGCRTSVFFLPRDYACLWDHADIPGQSEKAFQIGTNIAAYATGMEPLPDKLDTARVIVASRPSEVVPARGAVHIAQLMHNGDWRPNPKAIPHLAEYLHTVAGVDVVPGYEPLAATDPRLAQHPIMYMTGHYSFELKLEEVDALRQHLQRGGFLFANACCGREPFDTSFRKLAAKLFPDVPLKQLPPEHPILRGEPGVPLTSITFRPSLQAEQPNLHQLPLEGIDLDGRTVVVYSRYSLDCGLDGHKCFACRGVDPSDAPKVAGNIILYALSY